MDPDDHHVFVSLGCAAENLIEAASAHGLKGEVSFDEARDAVRVSLAPAPAEATPLFKAIPLRQCTRGDYDGKPISTEELGLLEHAGTSTGVRMLLLTERPRVERVLEYVVQGNTAQMRAPALIKELKAWIRFNRADAIRTRDGLFSVSSGNPAIPTWLGELAFGWFFTTKGENDKYAQRVRSSAGTRCLSAKPLKRRTVLMWVAATSASRCVVDGGPGRCSPSSGPPTTVGPRSGFREAGIDCGTAAAFAARRCTAGARFRPDRPREFSGHNDRELQLVIYTPSTS